MQFRTRTLPLSLALCACALYPTALLPLYAQAPSATNAAASAEQPGLLSRQQAAAMMPATVFFRGQTATVQARNTAGLRLAGGTLVLASRVDTGGYSSGIAEKYQAYLITEVPLVFGSSTLPPGAYGFGMLPGERFVFMDLGGHDVLTAAAAHDAAMARPVPLQITGDAGHARLYLGRTYVEFQAPAGGH